MKQVRAMAKILCLTAISIAALLFSAEARQTDASAQATIPAAPSAAAPSPAAKPAAADPNYIIGAQDVLDINVWKEEQLTKTIPVRPDAYFVLKHSGRPDGRNKFHVFLEADRSTMSHQRMAAKIEGYVAYYERRLHAKRYPGMHSFIVATVTETRSRAEELQKDLHPLIPHPASRGAYLFIPFEDLSLATLLPKATANAA